MHRIDSAAAIAVHSTSDAPRSAAHLFLRTHIAVVPSLARRANNDSLAHTQEFTMFQKPVTRRTFVTGMLCVGTGTACGIISGDDSRQPGGSAKPALPDSQAL